jgi:uncharacterized membrane protein
MKRSWAHRLYCLGIFLKGLDGALETIGGVVFLLFSPLGLNHLILRLTAAEIVEDPDDWAANAIRQAFAHMSADTKFFAGAYLLGHGLLKVLLVAALFRRKPWAYFAAIGTLALFIVYQVYRFFHTHSFGLLALTIFDAAVAALIWIEYVRTVRTAGRNALSHRTHSA